MICLKLVIDGNAVYEIDEDCLERRRKHLEEMERRQKNNGRKKGEDTIGNDK